MPSVLAFINLKDKVREIAPNLTKEQLKQIMEAIDEYNSKP